MRLLGVNVDHVATLRQARGVGFPDPIEAAIICQRAGADSIVAHLREDRRHIQDDDVRVLRKKLTIKLNLEMSIDPSVVEVALEVLPDIATLVPEKRQEKTTESGLDVLNNAGPLKEVTEKLRAKDVTVSYFVDADQKQIEAAADCGAQSIEIHTGPFAEADNQTRVNEEIEKIKNAVSFGMSKGLQVHVGHGLDYSNVQLLSGINDLTEFNIGFSIIARSVFVGIETAVKEMISLVKQSDNVRA